MILRLTDVSSEPLHAQIRTQIRAQILAGDLDQGEALPSIRGLARQERVSVITVQRAYEDLERESLIQARRGKGFFVADVSQKKRFGMAQVALEESLEEALSTARAEGLTDEQIAQIFERLLQQEGVEQ